MDARSNRILGSLPGAVLDALAPDLQPVRVYGGTLVHERGVRPRHVHFPLSGVVSIGADAGDGTVMEVAGVGREGMVGVHVFLDAAEPLLYARQQIDGVTLRLRAEAFHAALERHPALVAVVRRVVEFRIAHLAQAAACNRVHHIEQRAARWLLDTDDRMDGHRFHVTQEVLAATLGVQRPTLSATARALQDRGAIRYRYGEVTVVDRAPLLELACPCYAILSDELERLLPAAGLSEAARSSPHGRRDEFRSS